MLKMNEFLVYIYIYCETWKLHVNVKKTKTVIFPKEPAPKHTIQFNDDVIEIVKEFYYLGILQRKKTSL